jgi:hypothetical protein
MDNPTNVTANSGGALAWKDKLIEYIISHVGALVSAAVIVVIGFVAAALGDSSIQIMVRPWTSVADYVPA